MNYTHSSLDRKKNRRSPIDAKSAAPELILDAETHEVTVVTPPQRSSARRPSPKAASKARALKGEVKGEVKGEGDIEIEIEGEGEGEGDIEGDLIDLGRTALLREDLEEEFHLNLSSYLNEQTDLNQTDLNQTREPRKPKGPLMKIRVPPHLRASSKGDSADLALIDPLQRYLQEVRRYPLLTAAQEEHFSKLYYEQRDASAGQKLVLSNLRLVVKIAMEYKRAWTDVMDLIQEGSIGLSEAVKRFDPYRGVRFSTFARFWIHALILQYILKNFSMFSFATTRAGRKLFFQLERERERLIRMYGRATHKMIAEGLNVSEEEVSLIDLLKRPAIELDAPRGDGEEEAPPLIETLGDDGPTTEERLVEENLRAVFHTHVSRFGATLTESREVRIWRDRLTAEAPQSLESIAQGFGVTRERIRQIEERLKDRFKGYLEETLGGESGVSFEGR
jgi:RNA polymerase sigma-32 factor